MVGEEERTEMSWHVLHGEIVIEEKEELRLKQVRRCLAGGKLFFLE